MKRILIVIVLVLLIVGYGESRKFYIMTNGQYITLWKTFGNTSFIISGKCYGIFPSGNYIKTTNTNFLSVYAKVDQPDTIFFLSLIPCEVNNSKSAKNPFADFEKFQNNELQTILGQPLKERVFNNWSTLQVNIEENYARDKNGIQK